MTGMDLVFIKRKNHGQTPLLCTNEYDLKNIKYSNRNNRREDTFV